MKVMLLPSPEINDDPPTGEPHKPDDAVQERGFEERRHSLHQCTGYPGERSVDAGLDHSETDGVAFRSGIQETISDHLRIDGVLAPDGRLRGSREASERVGFREYLL